MPPKKKKGKKKKKKGAKDGELTVDDKYKRTLEEIEALKDHLAARKEVARRSVASGETWRSRMQEAEKELETHQSTQAEVTADMSRQYKTMQTEMGLRIQQLETELGRTRTQLEQTERDLKSVREEKEKMNKEKDQEIADLRLKIDTMGRDYERVLNDSLDHLIEKIGFAREKWEDKSTLIQAHNKQTLLEFGLSPLDL